MNYSEYSKAMLRRAEIISQNRSRRMRNLPSLPVPAKPEVPMVRVLYGPDGTYEGRISTDDPVPEGCTVKMERAKY